jgi:DbpA RNA binding domain
VWSEEKAQAQQAEAGGAAAPSEAPIAPSFDGGAAPVGEAPPAPRTDVARLYLNLGRKDGASDKDIRDLLSAHAGDASVSDIEVMNTHTYLNVAPADADRIVTAITGKELDGRQLTCESAKPRRR